MILTEITLNQAIEHGALVCTIIGCVVLLVDRNKSQKREITFTGTPVDRKDFDRFVEENKSEHRTIFDVIGDENRATEQRAIHRIDTMERTLTDRITKQEEDAVSSRRTLHQDVQAVSVKVAAVETAVNLTNSLINQRIVQIDGKLDRSIERKK